MDDLIRRKATGTPEEFATKLGLGKSVLMEELSELRELGAKIAYCRERRSYYYEQSFLLMIGKQHGQSGESIRGGNFFNLIHISVLPDHIALLLRCSLPQSNDRGCRKANE